LAAQRCLFSLTSIPDGLIGGIVAIYEARAQQPQIGGLYAGQGYQCDPHDIDIHEAIAKDVARACLFGQFGGMLEEDGLDSLLSCRVSVTRFVDGPHEVEEVMAFVVDFDSPDLIDCSIETADIVSE